MDIMENELVSVAMQIILHAGDARIKVETALKQAKQFNFTQAKETIQEAEECIHQAHISQTEVIQNETRGKTYEPCLLFAHAQDTLMTIMSELNLAKELIDFFEIMNNKIENN
ncbi:PTS lactose/cellobiose transporter subunit IIA [Absiella sp. AM29-15]|uniref:PTS lactose/cellobiose transporter subunit IIA n=1 Tax=Absiella sp. AM29-15 TaxID=2292278 RepID=UPI000E40EDB4|nr:PTS lactose/cellobiose transporter subunit IIA [Absiella sp. AM29-15]RGC53359.1 PTS lactose/cellobiose transporter subunit IIA [Absiella sp. AM29-15]